MSLRDSVLCSSVTNVVDLSEPLLCGASLLLPHSHSTMATTHSKDDRVWGYSFTSSADAVSPVGGSTEFIFRRPFYP